MANFNMGALVDWAPVAMGELMDFEVPSDGYRVVDFDLIADRFVTVHAVSVGDETWLVGCGDGLFSIRFSVAEPIGLAVMGDPEAVVYIRTRVKTQVVPESLDDSYTTIEPRPAGPSDEIKRMMYLMQLNQQRREQALLGELAALRQSSAQNTPPQGEGEQSVTPAPQPAEGAAND